MNDKFNFHHLGNYVQIIKQNSKKKNKKKKQTVPIVNNHTPSPLLCPNHPKQSKNVNVSDLNIYELRGPG